MRPRIFFVRCLGLAALLWFVVSCGSEDVQTCLSDQDCAPSRYCAQSGGVLFSSSRCMDRSLPSVDDVHEGSEVEKVDEDTGPGEQPDAPSSDTVPDDVDSLEDTEEILPVACTQDDECEAPDEPTTLTECTFAARCASIGTQTLTTRAARCENNLCVLHETTDTETCTRPVPGGPCGEPVESAWGDCDFGTDFCATAGTQSRTITTPTCVENSCQQIQSTETRACSRPDPAGKCKPDSQSWSLCEASAPLQTCELTGTQYLSVTTWSCDAGQCKSTTLQQPQTRACDRQTNGLACTQGNNSGTCHNGCCNLNCPPGQHCLECMLQ